MIDTVLSPLPADPHVTVIVPSFNQGAFLDDCIQSALRQDYPRLDVWIIDGGSSDTTLDVLRRYDPDPRVHWLSETDRGYADAVNKGLARAHGSLIGVQSSDDFYAPGAVRHAVESFIRHPRLAMVSGTFIRINEQGTPIARYAAPHAEQWLTIETCARAGNLPCQSACLFRKDLALHVGGCDPDLDWVADHDLQVRMMAAGARLGAPSLKLDRDWAFVRTHPGQRNRDRLKFKLAHVRACQKYDRTLRHLFTETERKLMLQQACWGEFEFRTRVLGQGLFAIPAYLRAARHVADASAPHVSLKELPWLLPLRLGRHAIQAISWRVNAWHKSDTTAPQPPASARWFA